MTIHSNAKFSFKIAIRNLAKKGESPLQYSLKELWSFAAVGAGAWSWKFMEFLKTVKKRQIFSPPVHFDVRYIINGRLIRQK